MTNLVNLIHNQSELVQNQNNKYSLTIGEGPLNILGIFIKETLQPPLSLVIDKYSFIENELLNRIFLIVEDFPDAYSEVKKNLLGTKFNSFDYFIEEINKTLFDYHNILVNEVDNYLNKSIQNTFLDSLEILKHLCPENGCGAELNSLRRLNNKEIFDIVNIYKEHPNLPNITKIKEKINKKINFGIKRKTSVLPEFTPDMGALTEEDVAYYLSNLQNTILKLNEMFFKKDYTNLNLKSNKFLQKINFTYLEKLKLSFDKNLVKFSTILTKKNWID